MVQTLESNAEFFLRGLRALQQGSAIPEDWRAQALEQPQRWFREAWVALENFSPESAGGLELFTLMQKGFPHLPAEEQEKWSKTFSRLDVLLVPRGAQELWRTAWKSHCAKT